LIAALALAAAVAAAAPPARDAFLPAFARSYYPGRSGQLMIVPREGHFVTRDQPSDAFMHGSPWAYDARVPLLLHGPGHVRRGAYAGPARHQDIAPTVLALLGLPPAPTMTGAPLRAALRPGPKEPPRVVLLAVLDGFRADYLQRFASELPVLSRLAREGARFPAARVDYLPTATGVAHATVSTGAGPAVHGIVVNTMYDHVSGKTSDAFEGGSPANLMAPALADVWTDATGGRAIVISQAGAFYAAGALGGHGACRVNGRPVFAAAYDRRTGVWASSGCYRLHPALAERRPDSAWEGAGGRWMGHDAIGPDAIRKTSLFAAYEVDSLRAALDAEPIGADAVADLVLLNFKTIDFVSHQYGPDAPETRAAVIAVDEGLGRLVAALEAKAGRDRTLVIVTSDHGMPALPDAGRRHFAADIVAGLHARFDREGRLVRSYEPSNAQIYVDDARRRELGLTLADLSRHLESLPFVFAAYTEDEVRRAVKP
jgi:predicted AlkP superfamily pyrophosphatase or phosphodiesterase